MQENLCLNKIQKNCIKNIEINDFQCFKKCEGMDIVSYDEVELNSPVVKYLSKLSDINIFDQKFFDIFEANPEWTNHVAKLSEEYRKITDGYEFPTKLKSKLYETF